MTPIENKTHKGWLMSGAGNTFAIEITNQENRISNSEAKSICQEFKVDGYLGLSQITSGEYLWNFFNSDGSDAEFCGNVARCAQSFLHSQKASTHTKHKTPAGSVLSWSDDSKNWVLMPKPKILLSEMTVDAKDQKWTGFWCNTGVPHFVLEQPPQIKLEDLLEISRKLRHHHAFGPRGTNVTWVQKIDKKVLAVTFERGVETYTQSCGTGAFAAALWWQSKNKEQQNFEISMPGGVLRVVSHESGWMMTGPVEKAGDWSF
jgi:diaminopimelate epimerase